MPCLGRQEPAGVVGASILGLVMTALAACHGSPIRNFDAFWSDLDQGYAVFDVRLPDQSWEELGTAYGAALGDHSSDSELFDQIMELARHLDDGHLTLSADDIDRDEDAWVSVYPHYDQLYALEDNIEDRYLDNALSSAAQGSFAWGTIAQVGYLSITSMDDISSSGDEDDDIQAAEAAMAQALADMGAPTGMVVDVRANEGGWDTVSLAVAQHFAGERTLAWSKQLRDGSGHDDFGTPEEVYVEACSSDCFEGSVVLLTSGGTFSAAETFALAMRVRDQVTLLGEPSSGHFSDMTDGELPNGWNYTFSGERYRAADGEVYEARGVPVEVPVDLDVDTLAGGQDKMLDAALELLGS